MEITGKVLREVEFRDRLRGYDTDEVDEFLEEVAVAVDELHRRLAQQATIPQAAPPQPTRIEPQPIAPIARPSELEPAFDDDSIRRTLVLAQRTADLAIKEANEEASRILESARQEADELVSQATETARRIRQEADDEFAARIGAQLAQREQLENDVMTLSTLVTEERDRLAESLQTVLRYVSDSLVVSSEVANLASAPPVVDTPPAREPEGRFFSSTDKTTEPDQTEIYPEESLAFTQPLPVSPPAPAAPNAGEDTDEDLWRRWTESEQFGNEAGGDDADPFGFNRRP